VSVNTKRIFNALTLLLVGYFLFLNLKGSLEQVSYHVIHIDERQVIDSILNVFQINDEFGRFNTVESENLKKILIILSELFIGGNLDFGRLWNNIFVFIAGPFYFISTELIIISERLVQISFFYISIIYFTYNFIDNKKAPLFLLASFSVPGAYYIIENPKPDSLLILFLLISFKKIFKDESYNLGFLFIGIAIGLKIIAIVPAIILGLYLIYPLRKINKLKDIFKINFYTIVGLIIAQPALLIPHPKIYSRIISANIHASRYNQEKFLSLNFDNLQNWFVALSKYYNLYTVFFGLLYVVVLNEILQNLFREKNKEINYYLISFFITSFFILLNVERIWIYYLYVPTLFLLFYIFSLSEIKNFSSRILAVLLIIMSLSGLNTHYEKITNTYFAIDEIKEGTMFETIAFIQDEYLVGNKVYSVVYWDPDFYFPRQGVTYEYEFKVLENWEEGIQLQPLYSKVDFIVTKNKFKITDNRIKEQNIGDLNIYFIKND
jgi:hypothetical protein